MRIQYGDWCMSCTQVYEWNGKFKNGVTSVEDSPLPGPAFTEDNITAAENAIRENRRVTVKEVALLLDIGVGSAHHIIRDELKFREVCAHLVTKRLTPEMGDVSTLVKRFCVGMMGMVKHFSSESSLGMRVGYTSTSRNQNMEWCHTSSPNPQKVRMQRSAGKVMLIFFWDYSRPIFEHYMPRGSSDQCHLLNTSEQCRTERGVLGVQTPPPPKF